MAGNTKAPAADKPARHGLYLTRFESTRIESCPGPIGRGHVEQDSMRLALAGLETFAGQVRVLGCCPAAIL
jgi:hypothetical protein